MYRQTRYHPRLVPAAHCPQIRRLQTPYFTRPHIASDIEALIVRFARENFGWGYDRIIGALANLGHTVSDQTVGNVLRRYGIPPAPKRSQNTTWKDFIAYHMAVLAGTDFFT